MNIEELLKDKTLKSKEKTETLSSWILDGTLAPDELLAFAERQKDPAKATCIEALEYATKKNPLLADESVLEFVTQSLLAKAPRVKWESAKVIGNIAHRFPNKLEKAVSNLLVNSAHEGTVVRWSAAFALGEILKLQTKHPKSLLSAIRAACENEEKSSIRKIYLEAIKKAGE